MPRCLPCADGLVVNQRRNCSSVSCPRNHVYDLQAGDCRVCPLGSAAPYGKCTVCENDQYTPAAGMDCVSCRQAGMEGLQCVNGLAATRSNYYAWLENDDSENLQLGSVDGEPRVPLFRTALCPVGLCTGVPLQQFASANASDLAVSLSSLSTQCRFPRRDSPLCGDCASGYLPWSTSCDRCVGVQAGLLFLALLCSFAVVCFLHISDSSSGYIGVLLFFLQNASLLLGPVSSWLSWLAFANLESSSVRTCVAPLTPYQQLAATMAMPLLLLAELAGLAIGHFALTRLRCCARMLSRGPTRIQMALRRVLLFRPDTYRASALVLLSFTYTSVSRGVVNFLYCVDAAGERVVFGTPSMRCASEEYATFKPVVVLVLIVYVIGYPLAIAYFLYRRRHLLPLALQLYNAEAAAVQLSALVRHRPSVAMTEQTATGAGMLGSSPSNQSVEWKNDSSGPLSEQSQQCLHRYGVLFASYRSGAYVWVSVVLARRCALLTVDVLLVGQPSIRAMAFAMLTLLSLALHVIVRPYARIGLHEAEGGAQLALLALALIVTAFPPPYSTGVQVIFILIVLPVALALLALIVRPQWSHYLTRMPCSEPRARKLSQVQPLGGGMPRAKQHSHSRCSCVAAAVPPRHAVYIHGAAASPRSSLHERQPGVQQHLQEALSPSAGPPQSPQSVVLVSPSSHALPLPGAVELALTAPAAHSSPSTHESALLPIQAAPAGADTTLQDQKIISPSLPHDCGLSQENIVVPHMTKLTDE